MLSENSWFVLSSATWFVASSAELRGPRTGTGKRDC